MSNRADRVTGPQVAGSFDAGWLGCHRVALDECASTNDEAARLARAGARHGTIVTALAQTAGRGRDGRAWASPLGLGLYLSMIVRPPLPLALVPPMTLAIGIGVCDAARELGVPASLKWPNDTLVDGRKLAGVLVEAQSQGSRLEAVIVGIGMNVGGPIPDAVAHVATTIEAEVARVAAAEELPAPRVTRELVLETVLAHVERWVDRYVAGGLATIVPAWEARMARGLRARATVAAPFEDRSQVSIVGEMLGLDAEGSLLVRDPATEITHRVRSGDVEMVPLVKRDTVPRYEPDSAAPAC